MKLNLRILYLYLFSFVGLIITVIGSVRIMELALKAYVFKNADVYVTYPKPIEPPGKIDPNRPPDLDMEVYQREETKRNRQREAASALSMIIVGLPLYLYHWKTIKKENK